MIALSRLSRTSISLAGLILALIVAQPLLDLDCAPQGLSSETDKENSEDPGPASGDETAKERRGEKADLKDPVLEKVVALLKREEKTEESRESEDEDEAPANVREEIEKSVRTLIGRMKDQEVSHMWSAVRRLEELGRVGHMRGTKDPGLQLLQVGACDNALPMLLGKGDTPGL